MKSLQVPFTVVGGKIADTTDANKMIEQKLINVLVTSKFERSMIPDYGAGVQGLLFDIIDELVEVDFKTDAAAELSGNVSGVELIDLKLEQTTMSEATITVLYRTPLSPARTSVFNVPLGGFLNEESDL